VASELAAGEITRVGSEPRAAAKGGRAHFGRLSLGSLADQPVALSGLSLLLAFTDAPLAKAAAIPLMVFSALPIGTRAWRAWRGRRRLNIDFLDTLAVAVSIAVGDLLAGAMVAFLVNLGEAIRDQTAARSRRTFKGLGALATASAWLVQDGAVEACPVAKLKVHDEVWVHPGEIVPVDGEVVEGEATVDQRALTGESAPILLSGGAAAWAATLVVEGQIRIRAVRTGGETAAAQVARLVETAPTGDTRIQNYAERFADRLVIPTLALALAAAFFTHDHRILLSVLVVDFGTGVRVAAPIAVLSSMIAAARGGVIFKSGSAVEKLAAVDTVVFDKTGTLTFGRPEVSTVVSYEKGRSESDLLALAASLEARSRHPIAWAIRAKAESLGLAVPLSEAFEVAIGRGVVGLVGRLRVRVGSERFMRESGVDLTPSLTDCARLEADGASRVFIAIDGRLAGLAALHDQIRAESASTISRLRKLKVKEIVLLSGDDERSVQSVAARLGVDRHFAAASPAEKVDVVQALQREGRIVAMIGDGINDGPALSYANVGIAVKHGAELAHESAGVLLADESLAHLVRAIEFARGAVKRIRWGYAIVAVWNLQALFFALTGLIASPAAIALVSDGSAIFAGLYGMSTKTRRAPSTVLRTVPLSRTKRAGEENAAPPLLPRDERGRGITRERGGGG